MGGVSLGTVIGYSSPAGAILTNYTDPALNLTDFENSWFTSSINLGALSGGPVAGMAINAVGRRGAMLCSIVPWLLGWSLLGKAK